MGYGSQPAGLGFDNFRGVFEENGVGEHVAEKSTEAEMVHAVEDLGGEDVATISW